MSSYYTDEEEEINVNFRHTPGHTYVNERSRPVARASGRPVYYTHGSGPAYLVPEHSGSVVRYPSTHRERPPPPVTVINNTYNEFEDDGRDGRGYLQLVAPAGPRSRSRSRSRVSSSSHDYELEKTRKELEAYKFEAAREKEKERMKVEMDYKRLREEKRKKEEEERSKKEAEEAVARWRIEEDKKAAKEKKEKEEREKEYKERMETDMRKAGMDETQIAIVLKKDGAKAADPNRPIYTRMSRKHLSIETLNAYRIDFEFDQDPDYLLIKRLVPEYEQDSLWRHTREIRERRRPEILLIDNGHHHHTRKKSDSDFVFVRKKDRKPSPSPLLTFLAGGKPR